MNYTESALTFDCDGDELVSVIAQPDNPGDVGVLVIVGGPQYRAGSHRQFVRLSRRLAADGFPVMRFDSRGMGDGAGDPRSFDAASADVGIAIDTLLAEARGVRRIVLWGLCDAASAALIYAHAKADARIAGMVLLNPWVRSDASLAKTHIKHYYGRRLLDREFWAKLARGDVDAGGSLRGFAQALARATKIGRREGPDSALKYQDRMVRGLSAFPHPVLLLLSGRDLTAKEFLEYAQADSAWRAALMSPNIERREFAEADHTFASERWSADVEAETLRWLRARVLAAR